MKQFVNYLGIAVVFILIGWFANTAYHMPPSSKNPIAQIKPTPLAKYTIENLSHTYVNPVNIELGREISKGNKYISNQFSISFDPTFTNGAPKKVTGLINTPKGPGPFPVVVLFRGYVDPGKYFTGTGTQHVGEFFANNGFITIAPDFLGYGESDHESEDIFEARFQTHTTAIETLKSVTTLKNWDGKNIFIWGHSNGGQIALTTLEITGVTYPTVLWAPVSKPFPFSILYYTDDATDSGKFLRQKTADFENTYNSDLFSLTNYFGNIKAPIQLNQGTVDEAVPYYWSDSLNKKLEELNMDVSYIKYAGADHNMAPTWQEAVSNALSFYTKFMKK